MSGEVVDLDAHRPVVSPIELVTMRGFGGLALRYRTVVWSEAPGKPCLGCGHPAHASTCSHGGPLGEAAACVCNDGRRVLWGSPWCATPELAAGAFRQLCDVLGSAYDDAGGDYILATVDVNEAGVPIEVAP